MRCLVLVSLLFVAASAQLPPPVPFDMAGGYSTPEDPLVPPFSMNDGPLNVTLEDGSIEELFEGDIMLTREQRLNRKGLLTATWPDGVVPYVITANSSANATTIKAALVHWEEATCITFEEKDEDFSGEPHLRFILSSGCWSYVGMQKNMTQGQPVSIGIGCATLGIIVHEVGHAIGFWHEQSRPDRDEFVAVLTENIQSEYAYNFNKSDRAGTLDVPYDYSSVMHYGSFGFSANGLPTLIAKDVRLNFLLGNRKGLSHRDKHLANLMYNCDASCSEDQSPCPFTCLHGGFMTKDCECACPPGTSGDTCSTVTGTYYPRPCGDQDITTEGTITSPNYPELYPPGEHCVWIITAPVGKRVQIDFSTFKIIYRSGRQYATWEWLAVHKDSDPNPELVKCGSELENQTIVSEGKRLALELHAYKTSYPSLSTGFEAEITFVDV